MKASEILPRCLCLRMYKHMRMGYFRNRAALWNILEEHTLILSQRREKEPRVSQNSIPAPSEHLVEVEHGFCTGANILDLVHERCFALFWPYSKDAPTLE